MLTSGRKLLIKSVILFVGNAFFDELEEWGNATENSEKTTSGLDEPLPAIFHNDQQPDTIYFQGLALFKIMRKDEAADRFNKLIKLRPVKSGSFRSQVISIVLQIACFQDYAFF